jgi:hypothetical protein
MPIPPFPALLHHYEQLEMRETLTDRRKTVAGGQEIDALEGIDIFKSKEQLRKRRRIQQQNNVL